MIKVAVLDDYQNAFEEVVDTEKLKNKFDFKILMRPLKMKMTLSRLWRNLKHYL